MRFEPTEGDPLSGGAGDVDVTAESLGSPWRDFASTRRRLVVGGIWATAGTLVAALFGPAVTILLVRTMTIREYGSFSVALAATILLTPLAGLGLAGAVSRAAAMEFVRHGQAGLRAVRWASAKLSWLCAVGALGLASLLTIAMVFDPSLHPDLVAFAILTPVVISTPWSQASQGIIQATFRPKAAFLGNSITATLIFLLSALVVVLTRATADEVAAARTVATLVGVWIFMRGAHWWALRRGERSPERSPAALARFGLAVLVNTTLAICISQLDVFMLGAFRGSAAAGSYAPVSRLADFVIVVFGLLGSYLLPALSAAMARNDIEGAVHLYQWTSRWALVLCSPALGIMIGSPGPLLQALFGSSAVLPSAARILAVGVLGNALVGFNGLVLVATGDAKLLVRIAVGGLCFNFAACVVLIPLFGAIGAALATAIPLFGDNIVTTLLLKYRWGIPPWNRPLCWTIAALAAGLTGAIVTSHVGHIGSVEGIGIAAAVAALPTLAVSSLTGSKEDRDLLSELLAGVPGRKSTELHP